MWSAAEALLLGAQVGKGRAVQWWFVGPGCVHLIPVCCFFQVVAGTACTTRTGLNAACQAQLRKARQGKPDVGLQGCIPTSCEDLGHKAV